MNVRRAWVSIVFLLAACGASTPRAASVGTPSSSVTDADRVAFAAWRAERRESLAGPNGWITLVGLYWLEPGDSTIGSAVGSAVTLPADRAPTSVGTITVRDGHARIAVASGAPVTRDGAPVTALDLASDEDAGGPTVLTLGTLTMRVISRGGRLALRVKDSAHPARAGFRDPPCFPWDPRWRVPARFTRAESSRTVAIANVLGMVEESPVAGTLAFTLDGQSLTLLALWSDDDDPSQGLFVMLRDATSDDEDTYPAGRFLDVPPPDASGAATLDFNRLETPPCGFTEFATCPLPPPDNVLAIAIRAGEKNPHVHHD